MHALHIAHRIVRNRHGWQAGRLDLLFVWRLYVRLRTSLWQFCVLKLASLLLPDLAHQHLVGVCLNHAHSCGLGESSTQVTPDESSRTAKQCVYVHLLCVYPLCVYHAGIVSRRQAVDRGW
jgi:hypothetical protein